MHFDVEPAYRTSRWEYVAPHSAFVVANGAKVTGFSISVLGKMWPSGRPSLSSPTVREHAAGLMMQPRPRRSVRHCRIAMRLGVTRETLLNRARLVKFGILSRN